MLPQWMCNVFGPIFTIGLVWACFCVWASVMSYEDSKDKQGSVFFKLAFVFIAIAVVGLVGWGMSVPRS